MTTEERTDIRNAIWLCAAHARLIDRDEITYTADVLRTMKHEHERRCAEELRKPSLAGECHPDLIALGPNIICVGELEAVKESEWTICLRHFVEGDIQSLTSLIEGFSKMTADKRYIIVNNIGDGRELQSSPSWVRMTNGYIVKCPIIPRCPRINADQLPADLAFSENHDFFLQNGDLAMNSGLQALPQMMMLNLSTRLGEMEFSPTIGTRFAEYYKLFRDTEWFDSLLKLEIIRQAAIPLRDKSLGQFYTPLRCVNRVYDLRVTASANGKGWLPIELHLDVEGVGRWACKLDVYVGVNN